mmetsp:Transcript_41562/g.105774  ORF Transcript_41562/g.105774 Transcript_41562/m.105774 type:complete len:402 (-) Transcript_41562:295-1500(-)
MPPRPLLPPKLLADVTIRRMHLRRCDQASLHCIVRKRLRHLILLASPAAFEVTLAQHPLVVRAAAHQLEDRLPGIVLHVRVRTILEQNPDHPRRTVLDRVHQRCPTSPKLVATPLRRVNALAGIGEHANHPLRGAEASDVVHGGASGVVTDVDEGHWDLPPAHQCLLDGIEVVLHRTGEHRLQIPAEFHDVHGHELVALLAQVQNLHGLQKLQVAYARLLLRSAVHLHLRQKDQGLVRLHGSFYVPLPHVQPDLLEVRNGNFGEAYAESRADDACAGIPAEVAVGDRNHHKVRTLREWQAAFEERSLVLAVQLDETVAELFEHSPCIAMGGLWWIFHPAGLPPLGELGLLVFLQVLPLLLGGSASCVVVLFGLDPRLVVNVLIGDGSIQSDDAPWELDAKP